MKSRLFWKLFIALFLAIELAFFGAFSYFKISGHSREDEISIIRGEALLDTAQPVLETEGPDTLRRLIDPWNQNSRHAHISLLDERNNLIAGYAPSGSGAQRLVTAKDGQKYILQTDTKPITQKDHPPFITVPMIASASIGFLFSLFLAWYFSRPLNLLKNALHAVAQGNFSTRVRERMGKQRDEIVDLGQDFDRMAAQLQTLIEARQRLLHDVSHELRSPLTRLQAAIGLLRQNPAREEDMLVRIEHEAERLNALVEEVLTLARLEVGTAPRPRERVDLVELLGVIVDDADFEAQTTGRHVSLTAPTPFICIVDGEMLCRAFENIIRNAIKYTAPETTVEVTATVDDVEEILIVTIHDHGPGVPPDMLTRIFDPFLRVETDQPNVGFGLGLAIARRAVEASHGTICAENAPTDGLLITIKIPSLPA